ncbi:hypothetical protein ACET69_19865, partial [Aeromonas veronii]
ASHFESQAIVFAFLSAPASLGSWLISSACSAVLVGAHYREPRCDDKTFLKKITKISNYSIRNSLFSVYIQCYPQSGYFTPILASFMSPLVTLGMPYWSR